WNKLDGAQYYRYQLASDKDFDQVIVNTTTTDNTIKFEPLAPGQYYLSIRGVDQFKLEGIDAVSRHDIVQPPPPPPVENDDYWKTVMSIGVVLLFL
ncbi:MAG: hypothetical protein WBN96_06960, partial [Gammaproteobacteria bacterium]